MPAIDAEPFRPYLSAAVTKAALDWTAGFAALGSPADFTEARVFRLGRDGSRRRSAIASLFGVGLNNDIIGFKLWACYRGAVAGVLGVDRVLLGSGSATLSATMGDGVFIPSTARLVDTIAYVPDAGAAASLISGLSGKAGVAFSPGLDGLAKLVFNTLGAEIAFEFAHATATCNAIITPVSI